MANIWNDLKGAFKTKNNELIQIIVINIVVFLVVAVLFVSLTLTNKAAYFSFITEKLSVTSNLSKLLRQPWTIITYMFLHEKPMHILFNMLFLFWFGKIIEEFIGGSRVTNLYVLGGISGAFFYILLYNVFPFYANSVGTSLMLGASGGVYAIVFGAATLLPDYQIRLLFLGDVKIKYIAWFYLIVSFIDLGSINAGGNASHIGGSILGFAYIKLLHRGVDIGTGLQKILNFFKGMYRKEQPKKMPRRNSFSEATVKKSVGQSAPIAEVFAVGQDEIDAILDKINKSGYESLSKDEKMKLFKASQQND